MFKEEDDGVDMDREEVGRSRAAPALTLRPHCPPTPRWCATASCVLPEHNYPEWASRPREQLFLHPEQRESVSHLIACWLVRKRDPSWNFNLRFTKYFHSLGGLLFLAAGQQCNSMFLQDLEETLITFQCRCHTQFSPRLSCQTSEWVPEVLVVVNQLQSF